MISYVRSLIDQGNTVPPELGNLSGLAVLDLDDNRLSGPIPAELGDLSGLSSLDLRGNRLTGPIPAELGSLSRLSFLVLDGNRLTGPIPSQLGSLSQLSMLSISSNDLTGSIPPELGDLSEVVALVLARNELSGSIPSEMAGLTEVRSLDLSSNDLTGPIPPELGELPTVTSLYLDNNELAGPIPSELVGMAALRSLHAGNNAELSGPLPPGLTALASLDELLLTGTDLCAPTDSTFQDWLSELEFARVRQCGSETVSSAYLTQAVQSTAFPVPLVAWRDALLRVFVTASRETSEGIPKIRATFHGGAAIYTVDIPRSTTPIPTTLEDAESSLAKSANVTIPGWVVVPGLEMVIEVDPDGGLDPELGVPKRIPETGRLPIQVEALPALDLTFVPFLRTQDTDSTIIEIASGMAADPDTHEMLEDTRALLPVSHLDVKDYGPVLTSTTSVVPLLAETFLVRSLEGGTGYYMGIMTEQVIGGESGVALPGGRVGFSVAVPFVIAHELGHNMNLLHAPCGGAGFLDRAFPQGNGSIGSWGYNPREGGALVAPRVRDVMSYCGPPRWISDHNFAKALSHRLRTESDTSHIVGSTASTETLVVWGGVDWGGIPFLEPALLANAPPDLPGSEGQYELVGRTANGDSLFSLSFDTEELADADGGSVFVFALPVRTEWVGVLESITLSGPNGSTTMDSETDRPLAILRDPDSGRVRAILRGADAENLFGTAVQAAGLTGAGRRVLFSRGIPDAAEWRR